MLTSLIIRLANLFLYVESNNVPFRVCKVLTINADAHIVSWEPEGRYCRSKMFCWEPDGRYCHWLCTVIAPFWFSTEHLWAAIMPFWFSADDICRKFLLRMASLIFCYVFMIFVLCLNFLFCYIKIDEILVQWMLPNVIIDEDQIKSRYQRPLIRTHAHVHTHTHKHKHIMCEQLWVYNKYLFFLNINMYICTDYFLFPGLKSRYAT